MLNHARDGIMCAMCRGIAGRVHKQLNLFCMLMCVEGFFAVLIIVSELVEGVYAYMQARRIVTSDISKETH
jgi:hypothetical protein